MGEHTHRAVRGLFLCFFLIVASCASWDIKREVQIPKEAKEAKAERPAPPELKIPEFVPATEDVSPLKTRIVDIVARNTPLRDVLHVIAEATNLNLMVERDVNIDIPITLTLRNVTAENALGTIFASVDYFYTIKDNMLIVKATSTKVFELGHPAVVQNYNIDVGGDILGGVTGQLATGGTTATTSTSSGTSTIKGSVTQSARSDTSAYNFWDAIERTLAGILRTSTPAPSATLSAPPAPGQALPLALPAGGSMSAQQVIVNRLTGTIVVTASKRNMDQVELYLNTIKKVINRQVLIEAKIVEVQLSESLKYGIDWSLLKNLNWSGVGTFNITTTNFNSAVSSTLPSFNLSLTGTNFDAFLKALQTQGEVRTLSNPRVSIMNGQTALLSVGQNKSFISRVETTTTTGTTTPVTTFTVQTTSVLSGVIIGIVPYINEFGEISLTITPIVSNLVSLDERPIGSGQNQVTISLPTVDLRELSTTIKVRDNQFVVIGGLIKKDESLQDNKVPLLGDIPLLGGLFTRKEKTESRSELVVVLQPVIVSR